jgi:transposase-like protein
MKLSSSRSHSPEYRIEAVDAYLTSTSLHETALNFNVHPRTLRRWIKRYEEGGKDNLRRVISQKKHWRRWSIDVERKTVFVKEKEPGLTLREAQNDLKREGIVISLKGIWNIWKRYGLIGFIKDKTSLYYFEHVAVTPATVCRINEAKKVFAKGGIKQAAQIINLLSSCCRIDILKKIPHKFLSLPRQAEQLYGLFGEVTFRELRKRAFTHSLCLVHTGRQSVGKSSANQEGTHMCAEV